MSRSATSATFAAGSIGVMLVGFAEGLGAAKTSAARPVRHLQEALLKAFHPPTVGAGFAWTDLLVAVIRSWPGWRSRRVALGLRAQSQVSGSSDTLKCRRERVKSSGGEFWFSHRRCQAARCAVW